MNQSALRGLWVLTWCLPLWIFFPALINLLGFLFINLFYFFTLCFLCGFFLLLKKSETNASEWLWQFSWMRWALGTPGFYLTPSGTCGGTLVSWEKHGVRHNLKPALPLPGCAAPWLVTKPLSGWFPLSKIRELRIFHRVIMRAK